LETYYKYKDTVINTHYYESGEVSVNNADKLIKELTIIAKENNIALSDITFDMYYEIEFQYPKKASQVEIHRQILEADLRYERNKELRRKKYEELKAEFENEQV
jgi:hypothetical protein